MHGQHGWGSTGQGEVEDALLSEGYVEHDGAKVLIAELEAGSPDQEFYDAKVQVLSEQIEHHVHEEEKRSAGFSLKRARLGSTWMPLALGCWRASKS